MVENLIIVRLKNHAYIVTLVKEVLWAVWTNQTKIDCFLVARKTARAFQGSYPFILGFHVTSEKTKIKLKLKILSFYLYGVKGIFKRIIITTLFESQIILAEHECSTNWGDCKSNKSNQIKSNVGF